MVQPDITLYTVGTPNGHKVSTALEILGIPYKAYEINFANNEQKEDWFLKINPNGKIPAIVDHSNGDFAVFESGAILLYLVENYDPEYKLWPEDSKLQSEVVQWVMFQMGGIGPMLGQANHFISYAPSKEEYAITRYVNETKRLINVLEQRLHDREFLVGEQLTIADISNVSWVTHAFKVNINIQEFPNVNEWVERVESIPAVSRGYDVPTKSNHREMKNNPELLKKLLEDNSKWIQKSNNQ